MPFEVTVHPGKRILEVVYPAEPTEVDVAEYAAALRRLLTSGELSGPWASLVDQRHLLNMPAPLLRSISALNAFAEGHRMQRSARVVSDDGVTSWRISRAGRLRVPIRSFHTREEALAWLEESAASQ